MRLSQRIQVLVALSALFVSATGCGPEYLGTQFSLKETESQALAGTLLVKSMVYTTANNGLTYSVAPIGNGAEFLINVTKYAGVSRNETIRLASVDSRSNYDFVLNVFRGSVSIINGNGTTTTVVLENYLGQTTGYSAPTAFGYSSNPFTSLNQFISSRL